MNARALQGIAKDVSAGSTVSSWVSPWGERSARERCMQATEDGERRGGGGGGGKR